MNILTIWNMMKRYLAGAIVGGIMTVLAGWGITEATSPETIEQIRVLVDSFLMVLFYTGTILVKTILQKKKLEKGEVVPERVQSQVAAVKEYQPVGEIKIT